MLYLPYQLLLLCLPLSMLLYAAAAPGRSVISPFVLKWSFYRSGSPSPFPSAAAPSCASQPS
jgi:hypothetical protein